MKIEDSRLGKRRWPFESKDDLVSSYEFEEEQKENLSEEELLKTIKDRIERAILETKVGIFYKTEA